ncbi:MAG: hypothetical protein HFH84_19120 [Lachnospiraceae bacterium]|nr:hypothetical protein [Lachnospiraceae bacterium]
MDQNSIIITIQFIYDWKKPEKNGAYEGYSYDIDLLVPKSMTCDELIESIKYGLEAQLKDPKTKNEVDEQKYGEISAFDIEVGLIGRNTRWIFTVPELDSESKDGKVKLDKSVSSGWGEYDEYVAVKRKKKIKSERQGADEVCDKVVNNVNYSEFEMLLISYFLFKRCYNNYIMERSELPEKIEEKEIVVQLGTIGVSSVNPRVYLDDAVLSVAHNDQIWLNRYRKLKNILKEVEKGEYKENDIMGNASIDKLGFMTTTRVIFDCGNAHAGRFLFQEGEVNSAFNNNIPEYNISDRPLYELDSTPVNIILPTNPPQKDKQNFVAMLLSPLLTMGSMLVLRLFLNSGSGLGTLNIIIMSVAMLATTVIHGIVTFLWQNRSHKEAVEEWRQQYQNYINTLIKDIEARQMSDIRKLHELFPPVYNADYSDSIKIGGLVGKTINLSGDIYGRSRKHPDFLKVRLGTTKKDSCLVPSVFEIIAGKKDELFSVARYKNVESKEGHILPVIILDENIKGTDGTLIDLPLDIARRYAFLGDVYGKTKREEGEALYAPVTLDIKSAGTIGIVRESNSYDSRDLVQSLMDNLILDLCFHHNPEDLQICIFFNESHDWLEQQQRINKYKYLPHFRELLGNFSDKVYKDEDDLNEISQFVFNSTSANLVFDRVHEIVTKRKNDENSDTFPNIIMIFINNYGFKSHQLSEFLPDIQTDDEEIKNYGLSFIFCGDYFEQLPKYCGYVIEVGVKTENERQLKFDGKCALRLMPHLRKLENQKLYNKYGDAQYSYPNISTSGQYLFTSDVLCSTHLNNPDYNEQRKNYNRAFKVLSALYYFRIAQGAGVPSLVELTELHTSYKKLLDEAISLIGGKTVEKANICKEVISNNFDKIQAVKSQQNKLDVTKSLAVPIGVKSGNEVISLDLHEKHDGPHMLVAGTTGSGKSEAILTYLIGLCMCYTPDQVNLLLVDMKGGDFIRRMGTLPHVVGTVSDIDSVSDDDDTYSDNTEYMLSRFLRAMKAEIRRRKKLFKNLNVKDIDDYIKKQRNNVSAVALPHLFLVVDEFTELMQFSEDNPNIDFKKEISSLARIGRSLGFHIILISQNIEGAITDNIRVNSRARLCLKVATKEASKEMIGSDAAADPLMPGFGRGFLYVGNGARSDYFQTAYSGASAITNSKQRILIPYVSRSGKYSVFYNSYIHNETAKSSKERADKVGTQIEWVAEFVANMFVECSDKKNDKPHKVLRPLLKTTILFEQEAPRSDD